MLFDWRATKQAINKTVHATFAAPAVAHFTGHDMPVTVRYYRAEELVGQEAYQDSFVYSQAMLVHDQLLFDLGQLGAYPLAKGLKVSVALELGAAPLLFEIGAVHPADRGYQSCDVTVVDAQ